MSGLEEEVEDERLWDREKKEAGTLMWCLGCDAGGGKSA